MNQFSVQSIIKANSVVEKSFGIVFSVVLFASALPAYSAPLEPAVEQAILGQMISTIDSSLNAYVGLTKKLVTIAGKLGKKSAGSKDRTKFIAQANSTVATYLTQEGKIYKSFKTLDAQKGDSAILSLVSDYYTALHKDLLKTKSKVQKRFGSLGTATVRRAAARSVVAALDGGAISTQAADQCLNGLSNQYSNQLKALSDQAAKAKDPYQGWAVQTGIEETRYNLNALKEIREQLKDSASVDAYNNFVAAGNAEVSNFNAAIQNVNKLSKEHPIITH